MTTFLRFGNRLVNLDRVESITADCPVNLRGRSIEHGAKLHFADYGGDNTCTIISLGTADAANLRLWFEGKGKLPVCRIGDMTIIDLTPTEGDAS